ncbi:MAG: hypothetical protein AB7I41_03485 [Candidatus Sericytochromatia bacterium]
MTAFLVFNARSLPFTEQVQAEEQIPIFLRVLQKLDRYKITGLRMRAELNPHNLELTEGYRLQQWMASSNSQAQYRELIALYKNVLVRQPVIDLEDDTELRNNLDAGLSGEKTGDDIFRAAVHYQAHLLSFASLSLWEQAHIPIWIQRLEEEQPETSQLDNFSTLDTLLFHEPRLKATIEQAIRTGRDVWEQRRLLCPHLELISKMSDLKHWSHPLHILEKGREALAVLNIFVEEWQAGQHVDYRHAHLIEKGLDISGESESVYSNRRLRALREHYLPSSGTKVYCEYHIKNFANGYRMYFYPEPNERKIYVVYFGPHLQT